MHEALPSPRGDDPVELTALRLLCIVFHLGETIGEDDARILWGEQRLQTLDHLLRQPESLALWILLEARRRQLPANASALAGQLRGLLQRSGERHGAPSAPRRLELPPWRSLDDAVAFLTCRDLLRLTSRASADGTVEQGYRSGPEAGPVIADLTSQPGLGQDLRRHCRLLVTVLGDDADLDLAAAAQRLEAFVDDEDLASEDDPTPRLFHSLFGEPL